MKETRYKYTPTPIFIKTVDRLVQENPTLLKKVYGSSSIEPKESAFTENSISFKLVESCTGLNAKTSTAHKTYAVSKPGGKIHYFKIDATGHYSVVKMKRKLFASYYEDS